MPQYNIGACIHWGLPGILVMNLATDMTRNDDPQAFTWKPTCGTLARIAPVLAEVAAKACPYSMFSSQNVGIVEIEQANGTAFFGAAPHTDANFDRWFVMLVVKAPENTVLHTAKRKSVVDQPKPHASVGLVPGEILLFDAHRVHWVDTPEGMDPTLEGAGWEFHEQLMRQHGGQLSVLVGMETPVRPSVEQAEGLLREYLRQHTPQCWARATMPAPRRRKAGP